MQNIQRMSQPLRATCIGLRRSGVSHPAACGAAAWADFWIFIVAKQRGRYSCLS